VFLVCLLEEEVVACSRRFNKDVFKVLVNNTEHVRITH
jgi:hypothetical protein